MGEARLRLTPAARTALTRRWRFHDFVLLNQRWLPEAINRGQAWDIFLTEGVERLAPFEIGPAFQPGYYREVCPELAGATDAACYRHWLSTGIALGWAGSEAERLEQLGLPLDRYPEAFDWAGYLQAVPHAGPDRWTALAHLAATGEQLLQAAPPATAPDLLRRLALNLRGRADGLVAEALAALRAQGLRDFATTHHLADACYRLGRWRPALALFREAAAFDRIEPWTLINGARAAMRLGAWRAGAELLARGTDEFSGHPEWRKSVEALIEARWAARSQRLRRAYPLDPADPRRARLDGLVERLVAETEALWARLDLIGGLSGAKGRGVVILANADIPACFRYRVAQKQEQLASLGVECRVFGLGEWKAFIAALPTAAHALIYRLPAWPSVVRAAQAARNLGVPLGYDIDDLVFTPGFPDGLDTYAGLIDEDGYRDLLFGAPLFRAAIRSCDYALASTEPLARAMRPLCRSGRAHVIRNAVDSRNELLEPAPRSADARPTIVFASGTAAHTADFNALVAPALRALLWRRPEARLLLIGQHAPPDYLCAAFDQVKLVPPLEDLHSLWRLIGGADINLAVLKRSPATDAKSEVKWLEAALAGVPSVMSRTENLQDVVRDGEDGVLVDEDGWEAALDGLLADVEGRQRMAAKARARARTEYGPEAAALRLTAVLEAEAEAHAAGRSAGRRLLLANVWYPPQAVGGASRVVHEAAVRLQASGEFEVAVLTVDEGEPEPYRWRVETQDGVSVIRLSLPGRPRSDWMAEDAGVRQACGELLQAWRPDLVHLHAVQKLTGSVAEACLDAAVPYAVTLHDGWWVANRPFLSTEEGVPFTPGDALDAPPSGVEDAEAGARTRRLMGVLNRADAVQAVSTPMAEIHRKAGVRRVEVMPNGVDPGEIARPDSSNGRLRLLHLGHVERHKGLHLLEAVLRRNCFDALELTAVDHRLDPGTEMTRTWGATPVRFIAKRPTARMEALYAEHHVLAAPSTWPESFGLVTREAVLNGRWVICGGLGALAEPVEPGRNGFVVDTDRLEPLEAVLAEMNGDPERFKRSPPRSDATIMSLDEHVRLQTEVYRRLLDEGV